LTKLKSEKCTVLLVSSVKVFMKYSSTSILNP
jgi:hypothetical protein